MKRGHKQPKVKQTRYGPAVLVGVDLPVGIAKRYEDEANKRCISKSALIREVLVQHVENNATAKAAA